MNPYLHFENYVSHRRGPAGNLVLFVNLGEPAANGCTYYVECQAHSTKTGVNSLREFRAYTQWLDWCPECRKAKAAALK